MADNKCANEICRNKGCGNQFDTVPCDFSRTCKLFSRIPTESITVERREELEAKVKMLEATMIPDRMIELPDGLKLYGELADVQTELTITTLSEKVKELEEENEKLRELIPEPNPFASGGIIVGGDQLRKANTPNIKLPKAIKEGG